jgi:hypothetical protein
LPLTALRMVCRPAINDVTIIILKPNFVLITQRAFRATISPDSIAAGLCHGKLSHRLPRRMSRVAVDVPRIIYT